MHQYTCIICPNSCLITVSGEEKQLKICGNQCPRGKEFAIHEHTAPMRIFTSTMRIVGAQVPRISVISEAEIPKEKLSGCQEQLSKVILHAPVLCGQKVISNIAGTGVDLVATRTLKTV